MKSAKFQVYENKANTHVPMGRGSFVLVVHRAFSGASSIASRMIPRLFFVGSNYGLQEGKG